MPHARNPALTELHKNEYILEHIFKASTFLKLLTIEYAIRNLLNISASYSKEMQF